MCREAGQRSEPGDSRISEECHFCISLPSMTYSSANKGFGSHKFNKLVDGIRVREEINMMEWNAICNLRTYNCYNWKFQDRIHTCSSTDTTHYFG